MLCFVFLFSVYYIVYSLAQYNDEYVDKSNYNNPIFNLICILYYDIYIYIY